MLSRLFATVVIVYVSCLSALAFAIEQTSNLYFSENPIIFDPPMVKKNDHYFIPIRSLVSYLNGSMNQSRKTYSYLIEMKDVTLNIKPNAKAYMINGSPKAFANVPFMYKTRLYVPLIPILQSLNIDVIKKNNHFYAYDSQQAVEQPQASSAIPLTISHENNAKITHMHLPISKKNLPLSSLKQNQQTKYDITDFLSFLGYKITASGSQLTLYKNSMTYEFFNGSTAVNVIQKQTETKKNLRYTPTIKEGRLFVNLQPFLNDLGFDYLINNQTIVVLKKLNSLDIVDDNTVLLNKNSRIRVGNGTPLIDPPRMFWDFSYTACPTSPISQTTDTIKKITFGQHQTTCRMVFHFHQPMLVNVSQSSPVTSLFTFQKGRQKPPSIAKRNPRVKSSSSLRGKVIVLDPGHGGYDPGAVTKNKDYEKHYTLDISKRIQRLLHKKGAKTILLRSNDTNPSLYQRVKKTNQTNGDFLVSVHVNSFINSIANGTETYYYKPSEKRAAKLIQKHMVRQLKLKNNGIKHAKMYILKHTKMPGVLIEPCFMTNANEYRQLRTSAFKEKIAIATVNGLDEYFKNK